MFLVEPSNENAEANLIASSISRFSRIVFRYVTEMREKIIPTASSGLNSSSMEVGLSAVHFCFITKYLRFKD